MQWNWLNSLVFGALSGFSELLPISSEAHRRLFYALCGVDAPANVFCLAAHLGALLALVLSCYPQISKLRREQKIAAIPAKRRKRQPDLQSLSQLRMLKWACVPLVLSLIFSVPVGALGNRLWLLSLLLAVNGVILYVPQFVFANNKGPLALTKLDGAVAGVVGALGCLPGVSYIGAILFAMKVRGIQGQLAVLLALLLCIPVLLGSILLDIYGMFALSAAVTFGAVLLSVLTAVGAFVGAYFAVIIMRFLAVRAGYSGFSYYCWGLALFTFILYLTV